MNLAALKFTPSPRMRRIFTALALMGAAAFVAALFAAPARAWANFLLVSYYLLGLGVASLFFVAMQYASHAGWSIALRRIPEAVAAIIPIVAVGMVIVVFLRPSLYPWVGSLHAEPHSALAFKAFWLNLPFFQARTILYLLLWILFGVAIIRTSRRQDADGHLTHTRRNVRLSIAFIVVFAVTLWLASFDWLMSLEPHWYSTLFGVYNFAGLFLSGQAAGIIILVWLQRAGYLREAVTENHLHDLGKLLFAFSTFWAYIWFSQYMLIWYANIPEETAHFVRQQRGVWGLLFILNLMLNWVIPFFILLPRATKRSPYVMAKVAGVVLLGRWLDLYLQIFPSVVGNEPVFGVWEIGMMLGGVGVFGLLTLRALAKAPLLPIKDPLLVESLSHH
ncbi:MAG TPA: hypothetical protein VF398_09465 [bacterium]|jgi:hypothetical protein